MTEGNASEQPESHSLTVPTRGVSSNSLNSRLVQPAAEEKSTAEFDVGVVNENKEAEITAAAAEAAAAAESALAEDTRGGLASISAPDRVDAVPAWQREVQKQPLVGPKESLTGLLLDFKGSDVLLVKVRSFIQQVQTQKHQQQQLVLHSHRDAVCDSAAPYGRACNISNSSRTAADAGSSAPVEDAAAAAAVTHEAVDAACSRICMRRVRKDGCCFYRGYMFGLMLYYMRHPEAIQAFIKRINEEFRQQISRAGYDLETVADFSQEMIDSLEQVEAASTKSANNAESVIEGIFNDVSSSNYIIVFAKLLVSTHMKLNSDMYLPFLTAYSSVEEFCKHEVDPMWVAAEELQITALTAMTQVPVEIIYFDQSPGVSPTHHVFPESGDPQVYLLYRPGHYDLVCL